MTAIRKSDGHRGQRLFDVRRDHAPQERGLDVAAVGAAAHELLEVGGRRLGLRQDHVLALALAVAVAEDVGQDPEQPGFAVGARPGTCRRTGTREAACPEPGLPRPSRCGSSASPPNRARAGAAEPLVRNPFRPVAASSFRHGGNRPRPPIIPQPRSVTCRVDEQPVPRRSITCAHVVGVGGRQPGTSRADGRYGAQSPPRPRGRPARPTAGCQASSRRQSSASRGALEKHAEIRAQRAPGRRWAAASPPRRSRWRARTTRGDVSVLSDAV